jgi:hypothetical protein
MTPKEKAKDLFDKMYFETTTKYDAKQCALIAVDEIINIDNIKPYVIHKEIIEFYQKVREEILKQ